MVDIPNLKKGMSDDEVRSLLMLQEHRNSAVQVQLNFANHHNEQLSVQLAKSKSRASNLMAACSVLIVAVMILVSN